MTTSNNLDRAWVRELEVFADNTEAVYNRRVPFQKNAMKRIVKGTYDPTKAIKLWWYYADEVRHAYKTEFGPLAPKAETMALAEEYARDFEDSVRRGYVTPSDLGINGTAQDIF